MLVVHSAVNESYEPHYDYYHDESKLAVAGHRIATVIMYLSSVSEGGETVFPQVKMKSDFLFLRMFSSIQCFYGQDKKNWQ